MISRLSVALLVLASCASRQFPSEPAPAVGASAAAATVPTGTGFEYVGGTAIQAKDPKALSAWYADVFGLPMMGAIGSNVFGGFEWKDTQFSIAIVPVGGKHPGAAAGTGYLVFHVSDYDAFVAARAAKGATPFETSSEEMGRFATFKDPEGNQVGVWGK